MKKIKNSYLTKQFFYGLLLMVIAFVVAFIFPPLFKWVQWLPWLFFGAVILDFLLLYHPRGRLTIQRDYPLKLSNGDPNLLSIRVNNHFPYPLKVRLLEELPIQFQFRSFNKKAHLETGKPHRFEFHLRPTERGIYHFGACHVFVKRMGLIERRISLTEGCDIPCYPSYIQLKKYSLLATTNRLNEAGVKRIRKIGTTMEFESIKEYVPGDDFRFINWKATAKVKKVMVNQYEDEKSQPIYSIIDLGRAMRMPFNELTLLDYAINSSLVLSNMAILKKDRAGLLTFSNVIQQHVVPSKRHHQMQLISEALYHVSTNFSESEFGGLYTYAKRYINQRALLFLYTNFETLDAMKRQLPYLKLLNKSHIVVVIVFKNTELCQLAAERGHRSFDIYKQIIAEKLVYEKELIIQKLQINGLQTILTEPEKLTVNTINKYLEIKARGLI